MPVPDLPVAHWITADNTDECWFLLYLNFVVILAVIEFT